MHFLFLTSWLVSAIHFIVWHKVQKFRELRRQKAARRVRDIPGFTLLGQEKEMGGLQAGHQPPALCPNLLLPTASSPAAWGSPVVLPWQRRPGVFTPGRLLRSCCPNMREI